MSDSKDIKNFLDRTEYPSAVSKQTLTVAGTAVKFTVPNYANRALVIAQSTVAAPTFCIRFWETGDTPTDSDGMPISNGQVFEVLGTSNLQKFQAIQATAGTHKLFITYYK